MDATNSGTVNTGQQTNPPAVTVHGTDQPDSPKAFRKRLGVYGASPVLTRPGTKSAPHSPKTRDDSSLLLASTNTVSTPIKASVSCNDLPAMAEETTDGSDRYVVSRKLTQTGRKLPTDTSFTKQSFIPPVTRETLSEAMASESPSHLVAMVVEPLHQFLEDCLSDKSQDYKGRLKITDLLFKMGKHMCECIPGYKFHHAKLTCSPQTVSQNFVYDLAKPLSNESQLFGKFWLDEERQAQEISYPQLRCLVMDKIFEACIEFLGKRYDETESELYSKAKLIRNVIKTVKPFISMAKESEKACNTMVRIFRESLQLITLMEQPKEQLTGRVRGFEIAFQTIADVQNDSPLSNHLVPVILQLLTCGPDSEKAISARARLCTLNLAEIDDQNAASIAAAMMVLTDIERSLQASS